MKKLAFILFLAGLAARLEGQNTIVSMTAEDRLVAFRSIRQVYDAGSILQLLVSGNKDASLHLVEINSVSATEGSIRVFDPGDLNAAGTKLTYKVDHGHQSTMNDNGQTIYSPYYTRVGVREFAIVDGRLPDILGAGTFPSTMIIPDAWLGPMADLMTAVEEKSLKGFNLDDLLATPRQAGSLALLYAGYKLAYENPEQFSKDFPNLVTKCDTVDAGVLTRALILLSIKGTNGGHVDAWSIPVDKDWLVRIHPVLMEAAQKATLPDTVAGLCASLNACFVYNFLDPKSLNDVIAVLKGKIKRDDPAWKEAQIMFDAFVTSER